MVKYTTIDGEQYLLKSSLIDIDSALEGPLHEAIGYLQSLLKEHGKDSMIVTNDGYGSYYDDNDRLCVEVWTPETEKQRTSRLKKIKAQQIRRKERAKKDKIKKEARDLKTWERLKEKYGGRIIEDVTNEN